MVGEIQKKQKQNKTTRNPAVFHHLLLLFKKLVPGEYESGI